MKTTTGKRNAANAGAPQTCIHTYTHAYIHTCMHTYIHTYIHTDIHTYIHTYIYIHVVDVNQGDICTHRLEGGSQRHYDIILMLQL